MNARRAAALAALGLLLLLAAWSARSADNEVSLLEQLDELDLKVAETNMRLEALKQREKLLNERLRQAGEEAQGADSRLSEQQRRLAARFRSFYKLAVVGRSEYLMNARDFSDLDRRRWELERLIKTDVELRTQYQRSAQEARDAQERMSREQTDLRQLLKTLGAEKQNLEDTLRMKKDFLDTVRQNSQLAVKAERELSEAKEKLSQKVARLTPAGVRESDPAAGRGFAAQKGRLPCPVTASISEAFGESEKGGARRFHGGIDLAAARGTTVRAPAAGTVVYAGYFRGFGNLLIIDHGGGFHTLYGHLEEISRAEGQKVKAGESIATSGESGSLKGPFLYLELRVGGKPQNPAEWFLCR